MYLPDIEYKKGFIMSKVLEFSREITPELSRDYYLRNGLLVSAFIQSTEVQHLVQSCLTHLKLQLSASNHLDWMWNSSGTGKKVIKAWTNDQVTFINLTNSLLKCGVKPTFERNGDQFHPILDSIYSMDRELSRELPTNYAFAEGVTTTTLSLARNETSIYSESEKRNPRRPDKELPIKRDMNSKEKNEHCISEPVWSEKSSSLNFGGATKAPLENRLGEVERQGQKPDWRHPKSHSLPEETTSIKALRSSLRSHMTQAEINSNHCFSNITFNLQTKAERRATDIIQPLQPAPEDRLIKTKQPQYTEIANSYQQQDFESILQSYMYNHSAFEMPSQDAYYSMPPDQKPQSKAEGKEKKKVSRVVYVKGIEKEKTSIKQLVNLFECFGDVEIGMFHNRKEYALVKFKTTTDAKSCVRELYGKEVAGKSLLIHYSELEELAPKFYSNQKTYYQIPSEAKSQHRRKFMQLSKLVLLRLYCVPSDPESPRQAMYHFALQEVASTFESYLKQAQIKVAKQPNEFLLEFPNTRRAVDFVMDYNCTSISYDFPPSPSSSDFSGNQSIIVSAIFMTKERGLKLCPNSELPVFKSSYIDLMQM